MVMIIIIIPAIDWISKKVSLHAGFNIFILKLTLYGMLLEYVTESYVYHKKNYLFMLVSNFVLESNRTIISQKKEVCASIQL